MDKNIINRAKRFATKKHKDQLRDGGQPYIVHPAQVARILSLVTDDPELIASGWLHDIIEDTNTTYEDVYQRFGAKIANLVNEVTKDEKKHFPDLYSREGVMLKFADRLSNLAGMTAWDEDRQNRYIKKSKFWRS